MTDLESSHYLTPRFQAVKDDIAKACLDIGRNPNSAHLLAVSKKHSIASIQQVYKLGQRAFGENYVQEGVDKVLALNDLDIEWHFIGPIQSNKSKLVAENFDWVHTIDRTKIAIRLNEQRPENTANLNVLIQVNISQEESKSGVTLTDIDKLADTIHKLDKLTLRGLMCIPAKQDAETLKKEFKLMQNAYAQLQKQYPNIDTLSMGMSGDLSDAITCGSTLVRIGTAIFGQRL